MYYLPTIKSTYKTFFTRAKRATAEGLAYYRMQPKFHLDKKKMSHFIGR